MLLLVASVGAGGLFLLLAGLGGALLLLDGALSAEDYYAVLALHTIDRCSTVLENLYRIDILREKISHIVGENAVNDEQRLGILSIGADASDIDLRHNAVAAAGSYVNARFVAKQVEDVVVNSLAGLDLLLGEHSASHHQDGSQYHKDSFHSQFVICFKVSVFFKLHTTLE